MGKNETARTWVAVIAIIIATTIFTVLWSGLSGALPTPSAGVEMEPLHIELALPNGDTLSLSSVQLFLGLGAVVVGLVVVTGVVIGFANLVLSKQVTAVTTSDSFQKGVSALEAKEKETLTQKQAGRKSAGEPQRDYKQWSAWSTGAAIIMFAVFVAYIISGMFVPMGEVIRNDQIINVTAVTVAIFVLITLLLVAWRIRPHKLEALDQTDYDNPPWDTIWVILSGLLILGLGAGLMIHYIGLA